jgi:hypothetical protein
MEARRVTVSPPKSRCSSRLAAITAIAAACGALLAAAPSRAAPQPEAGGTYRMLKEKSVELAESNRVAGWSYVVSGGILVGVSIPAFYLSTDPFARAIFSLGETLGVASVGYGSYLVLVSDDYTRFVRIVDAARVGPAERERLADGFLRETASRAASVRKIRVISHGLTAGLNLLNAFTSSQRDLKTALYFLGGINTLAALNFALRPSDEERLARRTQLALIPPVDGAGGLALSFRF